MKPKYELEGENKYADIEDFISEQNDKFAENKKLDQIIENNDFIEDKEVNQKVFERYKKRVKDNMNE